MPANTRPIYSRRGNVQGGVVFTTAAADYTGQGINNAVIFTADENNGSFISRIRCQALGTNTASVLRLFINNGLGRFASLVAAPAGTPTGTPSSSGGTLAGGAYFAKIVAVDRYGAESVPSTETASVAVTGPTGSIAWAWTASTNAVKYRVYVGGVTNSQGVYFEVTTNAYTQTDDVPAPGTTGAGRDSINGSNNNNWSYGEITLPATTAIATAATSGFDYPMNYALLPSQRIIGGLGTTVAAGWAIQAIAGDY